MAGRNIASATLRLGLATLPGALYPLADTSEAKETKTFLICPECDAERMGQFYVGNCGHKPADTAGYKTGDCHKGMVDPLDTNRIIPITDEELEEAKASDLEKGQLDILPRPAEQVLSQTWPSGTSYWFAPAKGADGTYVTFVRMIEETPEMAFLGIMLMRGNERLYRLQVANGGIVLQGLLRPSETHQYEAPKVEADPKLVKQAMGLAAAMAEDFDPEEFRNQTLTRMQDLMAAKVLATAGQIAAITPLNTAKKKTDASDLEDMLAASLAVLQKEAS